jgi:hypothetical protein
LNVEVPENCINGVRKNFLQNIDIFPGHPFSKVDSSPARVSAIFIRAWRKQETFPHSFGLGAGVLIKF